MLISNLIKMKYPSYQFNLIHIKMKISETQKEILGVILGILGGFAPIWISYLVYLFS